MELKSTEDVLNLRNVAAFKTGIDCAQSVTSLFSFKSQSKFNLNESRQNISIYSNFKTPKTNEIREVLEQVDSVMY